MAVGQFPGCRRRVRTGSGSDWVLQRQLPLPVPTWYIIPHVSEFQLFAAKAVWNIGFDFEDQARSEGYRFIAGVDEVGRGCLAGPVVAAACILDPERPVPEGLNDSKKLTALQRERIADKLRDTAIAFAIGVVEADEIDRINILEATRKAMSLAIAALPSSADFLLIDALQIRDVRVPQKAIIKGDAISYSIAAASVIAKTYRDDLMQRLDAEYPQYGFAGHKGYGSASHFEAIRRHGPCPLHRRSFRGVVPEPVPIDTRPFTLV
jgi:ribonuclease HII